MYLDGSVLAFYRELFINFSTTSMFLVYPILPHFLGHNFLSLNPSISDKRNIQTLGGDSERNIWCGPILSFIFSVSIEIFKSCQVLLVSSSLSTWLYKWILLSYDVVITMFVLENVLPSQLPLSLLILLCIAWGVYLYHYEDIYGEKPYSEGEIAQTDGGLLIQTHHNTILRFTNHYNNNTIKDR